MTLRCVLFHTRGVVSRLPTNSQQMRLFPKNVYTNNQRQLAFQACTPVLDMDYLKDPKNYEAIDSNIKSRKGTGSIKVFRELLQKLDQVKEGTGEEGELERKLLAEGLRIPNRSDPRLASYGENPHLVEMAGCKPTWSFQPLQFHTIANQLGLLRTENLGNITGSRSYYFIRGLAQLEQALIQFTVDALEKKGFILYSVPDLLHPSLIESCGMDTQSERTQIYRLNPKFYGDVCLSGTAEMALASYYSNETIPAPELPVKMAAVSRCYRAEVSNVQEERGIYRVHQFTKVEMFGVTRGEVAASDALLEEFVSIQKELFSKLGLHYQLLDMPLHELGAPAYRKFDIEAWMPGRAMYGEISSASNCTDYQSRRLNIRHSPIDSSDSHQFAHTVNGTACAVPRMLIALLETYQQSNGQVSIPEALQPYCNGMQQLEKPSQPMQIRWVKSKSSPAQKKNKSVS